MDAAESLHPTDQTLRSYGLGKLDDRSAEAVNEHLMECSDCRKRVAEMSADSFLQRVRDAQKPSGKSTSGQSPAGGTQSEKAANTLTSPPATPSRRAWPLTPITRSSRNSAGAGWAWSTWPTTRCWAAKKYSRS